jgi:hypothetical protein
MSKHLWMTAALLVALVGLAPSAPADDAKKDEPPAKITPEAEAVRSIGLAYELADAARETKTPEKLIAAALVLQTTTAQPGTGKAKVEGTEEKAEPVRLKDVAAKLLDEAKALAKGAKNEAQIIALADSVGKMESSRGAFAGPRSYYHRPGSGATVSHSVDFVPGTMAAVSVTQNSGRDNLTLTVTNRQGTVVRSSNGRNPSVEWSPGEGHNPFTITVRNNGPRAVSYSLYHN